MAPRRYRSAIVVAALVAQAAGAATTVSGPTITPGTITFTSADPDNGPASGSSSASVIWSMQGNSKGNWTLSVQATSSSLALCPNVPAGAITVQCTAFARSGTGNPTGNCAGGALPLSTSPQTLASGNREGGNSTMTATISFTFVDSWKYPASSSCSLSVTYTVTAD